MQVIRQFLVGLTTRRSLASSATRPSQRRSYPRIRSVPPRIVAKFHSPIAHAGLQGVDRRGPSRHAERASDLHLRWWRGWDLNPRPSGYEPPGSRRCVHAAVRICPGEAPNPKKWWSFRGCPWEPVGDRRVDKVLPITPTSIRRLKSEGRGMWNRWRFSAESATGPGACSVMRLGRLARSAIRGGSVVRAPRRAGPHRPRRRSGPQACCCTRRRGSAARDRQPG